MRGFVDLQVNGHRGVDCTDADLDEAKVADLVRALVADGTAILLPTLITAPVATYERNLPIIARALADPAIATHAPGIHLEGPFLSPEDGARGAHDGTLMRDGDPAFLDRCMAWADGRIRMLTVAAERPGNLALIRHAVNLGITVSLGHQLAKADDLARAADAGATCLTHLGNGMPKLVQRHANSFLDGLAEDRLHATFIGDGHHLPFPMLKLALRAKGLERSILISDAAAPAGLPPGRGRSLGNDVLIQGDGKLVNPVTGYLVGSSCTLRQIVNVTRRGLALSDDDVAILAVRNPARLIGLSIPPQLPGLPRSADGDYLPPD